ncbi:MAG: elongation factor P [Chloroflexaceae bacterium]|nr:elongation factor P [Chloroflexaceae bacterium]NJL32803.1 elongation factor P [Chloroflexaceae bacterium]NJO06315.1 elongation factor P [Chloroflexaceae bacterium]
MATTTADIRNGAVLRYNGGLWQVVEFQHVKPGKGGAFVRVKLKNMVAGTVIEDRMRAGENINIVRIEKRTMQYLYSEGDNLIFMDSETFDQIPVAASLLGDSIRFLKENENVDLLFSGDDDQIISAELPTFVTLEVTDTTIAVRGDTATDVNKPATLETGAEIQVPSFVDKGDVIRIDTRTGQYMDRVR